MFVKLLFIFFIGSLLVGCGKGVTTPPKETSAGGGNSATTRDPIVALTLSASAVNFNQAVTLSWSVPDADSCEVRDANGALLNSGLQGPYTVNAMAYPAAGAYQSFFTLTCTAHGKSFSNRQNLSVNAANDHLIFVTTAVYDGNLGGTAGANSICQNTANTAGLRSGMVWAAVLSVNGNNIHNRINLSLPVRNMKGETVFADGSQFYDQARTLPANPVKYTEAGAIRSAAPAIDVWTGTNTDGDNSTDCNNWTRNDNSNRGQSAFSSSTTSTWTNGNNNEACSLMRSLYCISLPAGTVVN